MLDATPLGRLGPRGRRRRGAVPLLRRSRFVTGVVLLVDGGLGM